ncbi:hypothetical protein GCM10014715_75990 [Streptomyces spiralis]|uniref:Uncharacterized protein n=1 Tax=Streptomyces spiralis TaxID=66376 RepID=A0A919AHE6_9ACTN|nr:hypothetical protein GCM10014715_75990 [Streptomyces spiralis]
MAQHDLAAYGDLVGTESEGDGLHGERLVDAGREVERSDHDVVGAVEAVTGKVHHAGETTRLAPAPEQRGDARPEQRAQEAAAGTAGTESRGRNGGCRQPRFRTARS